MIVKSLKDLSIQELWQLFPIELVTYRSDWQVGATEEIKLLSCLLADYFPRINHIGSTAIPGIYAKPIIDILVEVSSECNWSKIKEIMEACGYLFMSDDAFRMSFNKGYTIHGYAERVYHIHIHAYGDNDEVTFRNILIEHPEIAAEYEKLKLSLLPQYKHNRDGYTSAKSDFIRSVLSAVF